MNPIGRIVGRYQPMYDTLWIKDAYHVTYRLFTNYTSFDDGTIKTRADTNMNCDAQLGHPFEAEWTWMRLAFESDDQEKIARFSDDATIRLVLGAHRIASELVVPAFLPVMPTGDEAGDLVIKEYLRQKLAKGELEPFIRSPRVYQASIGPIHISSSASFRVEVSFKRLSVPTDLRVKIMLGPTLFSPD
jgi:hypothetical protein